MTKYFISTIFILALFFGVQYKAKAGFSGAVNTEMNSKAPVEKGHGHAPTMDETPHIHHFHKHRVKKLKRHHHYWMASKVLLALIHGALLFIAYMHLVH